MTRKTDLKLLKRIEELEAQVASQAEAQAEQRTSRRGMLRLAGAAAVGGLAAAVTADPVAAIDGSAVLAGVSGNTATLPTGIAVAAASTVYGLGCYETGLGALPADVGRPAVLGHATGTAFTKGVVGLNTMVFGTGVLGVSTFDDGSGSGGIGVWGKSRTNGLVGEATRDDGTAVEGTTPVAAGYLAVNGVGVLGSGLLGALRLDPNDEVAPPNRATQFFANTFETDGLGPLDVGNVWFCYEGGTPGKWRKLAGPNTAGAFHAIKPTRVYDSRAGAPLPSGVLLAGANRTVSVADGRDGGGGVITTDLVPAGATAVAANITITGTIGSFGYLAINPGGDLVEGGSTINWSSPGQTIANGVTLTLNTTRQLTVLCGGLPGAATNFIIDIAGYYL
ncbi:MAG: hypothetical protein HY826_00015 [Actinobacteria bacterium]|nr:hypothetical protein [Actinomycetota bacterium]